MMVKCWTTTKTFHCDVKGEECTERGSEDCSKCEIYIHWKATKLSKNEYAQLFYSSFESNEQFIKKREINKMIADRIQG
jgi:hypothetical protein